MSKFYFEQLPNALPHKMPKYDDSATDLIVLFPLFTSHRWSDIDEFYLKMAVWNRFVYLRNSDAVERRVPVKFYIEASASNSALDYLSSWGVDASDIICFDSSDYKGVHGVHNLENVNLGLKLVPILDDTLTKYRRILINDVDLFLCRTPLADDETYSIVAQAEKVPMAQIGTFKHGHSNRLPDNWLDRIANRSEDTWYHNAGMVLDIASVRPAGTAAFHMDLGVQTVIPNQFHTTSPTFKAFSRQGIKWLADDEAILSIWHHLFPETCFDVGYGGLPYICYQNREQVKVSDMHTSEKFYYLHDLGDHAADFDLWYSHLVG